MIKATTLTRCESLQHQRKEVPQKTQDLILIVWKMRKSGGKTPEGPYLGVGIAGEDPFQIAKIINNSDSSSFKPTRTQSGGGLSQIKEKVWDWKKCHT